MDPTRMAAGEPSGCLIIGDLEATRMACSMLSEVGQRVTHLARPTDVAVRTALRPARETALDQPPGAVIETVVVIVRSDVQALRWALFVEHTAPGIELVVSVFDRTVAQQLRRVVPHCQVMSAAEVAAPAIVAAAIGDGVAALPDGTLLRLGADVEAAEKPFPTHQDTAQDDGESVHTVPFPPSGPPWWHRFIRWVPRSQEGSAALMLAGLASLLGILVLDWGLGIAVLHDRPLEALYVATRVVATVGPADAASHEPPGWYLLVAVLLILATVVATGSFIAGLVDWLRSSRSVGLVGRRSLPRSRHVVVAGLGQVGLRVSLLLRSLGVPVVVVERTADAPNLRLARAARIPVIIGHADDRAMMERVGLPRALGLAALGSDELDNVAIAITALAVAPETRVVVRAGDDDVITETTSLFRIGQVVDVSALMAFSVALAVGGHAPDAVFGRAGGIGAASAGTMTMRPPPRRCACAEEPGDRVP